jgi:hypothetical protein
MITLLPTRNWYLNVEGRAVSTIPRKIPKNKLLEIPVRDKLIITGSPGVMES